MVNEKKKKTTLENMQKDAQNLMGRLETSNQEKSRMHNKGKSVKLSVKSR